MRAPKMLSFKVCVYIWFYVLVDVVLSERVLHGLESQENEQKQIQHAPSEESQNDIHPLFKNRVNPNHNVNKRSPLLKPLKRVVGHVVGHVAGHVRDHLGFHITRPDCRDRHFHPHHQFPFHHEHNSQNFPNDFPKHHDFPDHYGHPPGGGEHIYQPKEPEPSLHHHVFNDKNVHDHIHHEEQPEDDISDEIHTDTLTNLDQTTKKNKPSVVYPPFGEDSDNKKDNDYPVSDFDRKTEEKNIGRNKEEEGKIDLGNKPGSTDDEKNNTDWMNPADDDVENGEIPPTSQIDIRFRKN